MKTDAQQNRVALVVDSDDDARELVERTLSDRGYETMSASSGSQAMRLLDTQPWSWAPDLVCVDLLLSGVSGYNVIRRLRERYQNRKLPIFVLSRMSTPEDIMEAQAAGADVFVKKPLSAEKLDVAFQAYSGPELPEGVTQRASMAIVP